MATYLTYLGWGVGVYFAIGVLVALFFFAVTSYVEGRVSLRASDIGMYAYMALIWPAYAMFIIAVLFSSR